MSVISIFKRIQKKTAERFDIDPVRRIGISKALNWFINQVELDIEKKASAQEVRVRWAQFTKDVADIHLLDDEMDNEKDWGILKKWIMLPSEAIDPFNPIPKKVLFPYDEWKPDKFFKLLGTRISNVKDRHERVFMRLAIGHLEIEAGILGSDIPPAKHLDEIWAELHPLLAKHKLLDEFKKYPRLMKRVKDFIKTGRG